MSDFKSLKLNPSILKAIEGLGYETPTPIQAQAIPQLLEGKDLLGIAQTGTGKTAAFSLPILNQLEKSKNRVNRKNARCLILTPTRELASQIQASIKDYGKHLRLSTALVFGGVGKSPQIRNLSRGVDILVATPGRLLDLMGDGHIGFADLEIFVLDEADRMLDMGFIKDIRRIMKTIPAKRQTLLFSATMPKDIESLAKSLLKNPAKVEVTPQATTVEKIDQSLNMVEKTNKQHLLKNILEDKEIKSILVFTRTKHGANRVVKQLDKHAILAAAIHGNKSQNAREKALSDFKAGKIRVLVATDIASRGIDIPQVSHVVNYEVPDDPESYVHRIGRTGRAGRNGIAITFCCKEEIKLLKAVEKFINLKIPVDREHAFYNVAARPEDKITNSGGRRFTPKKSGEDSGGYRGKRNNRWKSKK